MSMYRITAGLALRACILLAPMVSVNAQVIIGRAIDPSGTALPGVLLVFVPAGTDSAVARTTTGLLGEFVLRTTPGTGQLRALRIGHRPEDLGTYTLAAGQRLTLELLIAPRPVTLPAVMTAADTRCSTVGDAGPAAATLFDEARKSLNFVAALPARQRPEVTYLMFEVLTAPDGRPLGDRDERTGVGSSLRPFAALDPELLARVGYVSEDTGFTVYRAPDARVLTSVAFARDHCIRLADDDAPEPGWVGVAFEPARGADPGIIRIAGTFWLDRTDFGLRRIEFRYIGLRPPLDRAGLGGFVELTLLPEGIGFVSSWEIRMPRTAIRRTFGGWTIGAPSDDGRLTLEAIQRAGGEVVSFALGGDIVYQSGSGARRARSDAGADAGADDLDSAPAEVLSAGCPSTGTGGEPLAVVIGVLRTPPDGESGSIEIEWREQFRVTSTHEWSWRVRTERRSLGADGRFQFCGVPRSRLLTLRGSWEGRETRMLRVRVPWSESVARVELRLPGRPARVAARAAVVRVLDATGESIPHAVVSVAGLRAVVADADGRAVLRTHPGSRSVTVRRLGYRPYEGTLAADPASGDLAVTLETGATSLTAVRIQAAADSPLSRSGFYDRVAMVQRGAYSAEFITPEEIEERNAMRVSRLLAGRTGVRVDARTVNGAVRTVVRGRDGCVMTILIDGQRMQLIDPSAGPSAMTIDDLVDGRSVAAIEIYPSTANAPADLIPLTGGGSCGLVAIWTGAP
jgi:hypothetical protein